MQTIQLKIDGMSCGSCVASVTRALQDAPGVDTIAVNLKGGVATVTSHADTDGTNLAQMVAALGKAGYPATALSAREASAAMPATGPGMMAKGCGTSGGGCCCAH